MRFFRGVSSRYRLWTGFTPFYLLHAREAETTLDTMLPFCPNDFDDNNITKIAARAEESRQLARVHTLRAQDKDRRRYDSNTKWYPTLPEISTYGFILHHSIKFFSSVTMHQDLAAFYENPEVPNSFGGVEALHRSVKGNIVKDVKHWLSQKDAYTLHKPVRHKFQRNRVFVSDIDRQFQADLVDMQSLAEFNKGFYVYSDLISPQIVGDTQAPLLRIVRTKGKDGETISQYYDRPQYLPLVRHSFQTIQSELRLNSGDFVPFERGQIGSGLTHYKGINFQRRVMESEEYFVDCLEQLYLFSKGGKTIGKEVLMTGVVLPLMYCQEKILKSCKNKKQRKWKKKLAQKAIDRVQSMVGKGQYKEAFSECVKSELELFNLPGTQTVIQDGQWKQFHPLSNVFDNAPVEFHISGSAEDYIDLSQTQLYVKAKIVKVDNTPITKDDTIRPVNLFLHSLFSQVDVSLNDRVVSNSQ
ncbi:uncharacterized protein F54H12.2 [Trichonephila clavipes]|nr:uncharacterized protein F54H12.2 [Trichonephila clavipes]